MCLFIENVNVDVLFKEKPERASTFIRVFIVLIHTFI